MNTLSKTFRFVVLGVIVMVVVVGCVCVFPTVKDSRITLYEVAIGGPQRNPPYVEWTTQGDFDRALAKVCAGHQGTYEFYVKLQDKDRPIHPYRPCRSNPPGNIRTVKVTKSRAADKIAAGESVANDPNAMHRIQSPNPDDVVTVLDALKK